MFVRTKRVKGKEYAYLVKNVWTDKGPRQRVMDYLGAVIKPDKCSESAPIGDILTSGTIPEIVSALVSRELENHGFKSEGKNWVLGNCTVHPKWGKIRRNGKHAALRLNEGFLCDSTLRALQKVMSKEEIEGKELASAILEAGIGIESEGFVRLYERLTAQRQS